MEGAQGLARALRLHEPSVIGRIEEDRGLRDMRTVLPEQDTSLVGALRDALGR